MAIDSPSPPAAESLTDPLDVEYGQNIALIRLAVIEAIRKGTILQNEAAGVLQFIDCL